MTAAMRPPQDSTDYLLPNNPGSQTNSNYSMATEKTELLSPDTCSTMSCVPDDKLLEMDEQLQQMHHPNNVKLWNDESVMADQQTGTTPYNPVNLASNYSAAKVPYTSGVVLNPTNLSYQKQQPCVRYVNVNMSPFGVTPAQTPANSMQVASLVSSEQPPSTDAPSTPLNC